MGCCMKILRDKMGKSSGNHAKGRKAFERGIVR
jgi:hypothetical protein